MKKPKHNSLALQCLAWAALALVSLPANAANSAAPDFTTIPSVTPATSNANSFVALNLTPEALSTDNPVVKINMARWFSGSTLIMQEPNGDLQQILFQNRADAAPYDQLMQDDATTEVPFKAGETRVIIDIGGQRTLQSFGFFSFSARGTLDIYYSNSSEMIKTVKTDPAEWKSANAHTDINTKQVVSLNLGAIDAHYIMIVFTMAEPGTISPLSMLGVISTTKDKKATAPNQASDDEEKKKNAKPVNPDDLVEFDYANAAYGTKVTHVLGGNTSEAQNVLGTNPKQSLILGSGTDQNAATPTPTAQTPAPAPATDTTSDAPVKVDNIFVVDMGKDHDINKVGLLFKTEGSGKFDFYLLKQLPTKTDNKTTGAIPAKTARLSRYQPILLAASEGSLAEALMLAQGAPAPDAAGGGGSGDIKPVDYLPADFFTNTKPTFTQEVAGNNNDNKITQNYDNNLQFRFALIRWVPTTPNQPPVEIFKVNLIGKVSIDNYVAASKSNINLGPPASAPPSYAVVGPNPPPGQTADPGPGSNPAPTPTPTPTTKNPSPAPSQQISDTGGGSGGNGGGTGGGGGGGGGGSDPTEPPTPTAPSITP